VYDTDQNLLDLDVELKTEVTLDMFKPRDYQKAFFKAMEHDGYKRALLVWPRRSGKDLTVWNFLIREAMEHKGVYFYLFPTYNQARKIIYDSITHEGKKFVDYIPKAMLKSVNSVQLAYNFVNGSRIQLQGSDNVDNLVGTGPRGLVYSEAALQSDKAYRMLRPAIAANDGWVIFESTPRGKNFFWELYNIAKANPKVWFCSHLSVYDTGHVDLAEIQADKDRGEMSEDLIQQEWFCSFELGVEGAYYTKYIDKMRIDGRIGNIDYETGHKVHTAWDIGYSDATSIIFFQQIGPMLRVIDYYEASKQGLEHYAKVINQKAEEHGWIYGRHFGPHDIAVHEWTSGLTRLEKAADLGIHFSITPAFSLLDGIETLRSAFSRMYIDENKCSKLIKALENYRQEYDEDKKIYKEKPLHNWASHAADCARYMAINVIRVREDHTAEDIDRMYNESQGISKPSPFNEYKYY